MGCVTSSAPARPLSEKVSDGVFSDRIWWQGCQVRPSGVILAL